MKHFPVLSCIFFMGRRVYLEFGNKHDGTFGAVTNADGLARLQAIYGVTKFGIGNDRCQYTSTLQ